MFDRDPDPDPEDLSLPESPDEGTVPLVLPLPEEPLDPLATDVAAAFKAPERRETEGRDPAPEGGDPDEPEPVRVSGAFSAPVEDADTREEEEGEVLVIELAVVCPEFEDEEDDEEADWFCVKVEEAGVIRMGTGEEFDGAGDEEDGESVVVVFVVEMGKKRLGGKF